MNPEFEEARKNIRDTWGRIKKFYNEVYGIEENQKPSSMHELIEQRKNRKPFYKNDNKKPWE